MPKKHSYDWVKSQFEDRGYKLISEEYKNTNEKLEFKCPSHPDKVNSIRFSDFRRGHGCKYCGFERRNALRRIPFEVVKKAFDDRGYELLETEYINSSTPMKYRCPHHPDKDTKITYDSLRDGAGCIYCARLAPPTIEEVREEFASRGYTLISDKYVNTSTKLTYICNKHRDKVNKITYGNLKYLSQGCPDCAGVIKYTLEDVRKLFEQVGYELIETEYKTNKTKMRYKCPKHPHKETKISLKELNKGVRCRYCYLDSNRGETHPAYNPDLSPEDRERKRFYPEYYDFRRKVFERDDYTCTICNDSTGGNLVAHHLDGYDWCRKKRTEVDNGVTLCNGCHKDFHEEYGYGGNTREQFLKWVLKKAKKEFSRKEVSM